MYMTPDLRVAVPCEDQPQVIEQIRAAWAEFPQQTVDGLRIDMPGGWALVRSSVTAPALTFRFEGLDWHALDDLVERICHALAELGDEVWSCYRAAMGVGVVMRAFENRTWIYSLRVSGSALCGSRLFLTLWRRRERRGRCVPRGTVERGILWNHGRDANKRRFAAI